ncbi:NYN domain-containing protein [Cupriavidus gilardii]|uniref:NYN domain-containing protein n=1 Tax=Cupriavidus gilardii TaxID=82541 RepID=UPI001EE52524|nr:NYN domain-containing protein [Cupriavidus gilardii]MCG5259088.1 NYN domain-containing protein [Cupriavidus gilardii]MDF9432822.1 NYN domain-containing protein [Cupriavidus gilardii]
MNPNPRQGTATLAVLIDADNAAPGIVEGLLAEVAKYGVAAVKRIYGDWTKPNLSGWKECLLSHSIQPIQQFRYTVGKNATDSAMIIDAMDLLYTGRFDGFCIVSSDSDFTRLASRIREQGLTVYGFGERKTPKPFVTACDKFIYSDLLRGDVGTDESDETTAPARRRSGGELRQDTRLVRLLQSAAQAVSDEEGWTTLGSMGTHIAKQAPEFDSRNYGYGKLSELVAATGLFEVETRNGGNNKTIWVRLKRRGEQRGGEQRSGEQRGGDRQGHAGEPRSQGGQGEQRSHGGHAEQRDPVGQEQSGQDVRGGRGRRQGHAAPAQAESAVPAQQAQLEIGEPAPAPVQADEPVAADVIEPAGHAATPEPAAPESAAPESAAPGSAAPRSSRGRRGARRPDVKLSDTPWPIDSTVFAAPASASEALEVPGAEAPANGELVESAESVQASETAPPARKRRSTAPRKRAAKKAAAAE